MIQMMAKSRTRFSMRAWWLGGALVLGLVAQQNANAEDLLTERLAFWKSQAFLCTASPSLPILFPSRPTGEASQPCDDGDMTLFNGLLCAAGIEEGCTGVREALDPASGQWFRSPRIRINGNDRGGADFSPDMALGAQLYLVAKKDSDRAWKWLMWMHENVPCTFELLGHCVLKGLPRFCPQVGCELRPGDAASLAETVSFFQENLGMPALPDGRLRGHLGSFSGSGPLVQEISALINRPGFPQHLVAVSILLSRNITGDPTRLKEAAKTLADRTPTNAFFAFLNEGKTQGVIDRVIERCPAPGKLPIPPLNEWQWERDDAKSPWTHSAYWDCIFMGALLGGHS